jgi:nucleotide-binding universal stress UspA family protein
MPDSISRAMMSAFDRGHRQGLTVTEHPALLCYDGSSNARRAIEVAGALVGGGSAVVLTVWLPVTQAMLAPVSSTVALAAGWADEFDQVSAKAADEGASEGAAHARDAGFDASTLAKGGDPREVILVTAQELDARVIVLGSRGRGPAASTIFGSVATAVLHHCRGVPLLVVPPEPSSARPSETER